MRVGGSILEGKDGGEGGEGGGRENRGGIVHRRDYKSRGGLSVVRKASDLPFRQKFHFRFVACLPSKPALGVFQYSANVSRHFHPSPLPRMVDSGSG